MRLSALPLAWRAAFLPKLRLSRSPPPPRWRAFSRSSIARTSYWARAFTSRQAVTAGSPIQVSRLVASWRFPLIREELLAKTLGNTALQGPTERAMIKARSNGSHHHRPKLVLVDKGTTLWGESNGTECRSGRAQGGRANDAGSMGVLALFMFNLAVLAGFGWIVLRVLGSL